MADSSADKVKHIDEVMIRTDDSSSDDLEQKRTQQISQHGEGGGLLLAQTTTWEMMGWQTPEQTRRMVADSSADTVKQHRREQ